MVAHLWIPLEKRTQITQIDFIFRITVCPFFEQHMAIFQRLIYLFSTKVASFQGRGVTDRERVRKIQQEATRKTHFGTDVLKWSWADQREAYQEDILQITGM